NERTIGRAAGEYDRAALARLVHEGERVPLALKNVDVIARSQLADDKRPYFCAGRIITPRAISEPIMNRRDFALVIMHRKRNALLIQPHNSILLEPGAE